VRQSELGTLDRAARAADSIPIMSMAAYEFDEDAAAFS
jgi:hypothetical protein